MRSETQDSHLSWQILTSQIYAQTPDNHSSYILLSKIQLHKPSLVDNTGKKSWEGSDNFGLNIILTITNGLCNNQ